MDTEGKSDLINKGSADASSENQPRKGICLAHIVLSSQACAIATV